MAWAPDYVTVDEVTAYLRIDDELDDAEIQTWVSAASRLVDTRTNRQFGQLDAPAVFTYDDPPAYDPRTGLWLLGIDDVTTVTGMLVAGIPVAASGASLWPRDAVAKGRAYTHLCWRTCPRLSSSSSSSSPLEVTARFGWSAVPAQVAAAVKLQVARFHARRDAPFGVAGSPTQGSEVRLLARLDPDVAVALSGLSRRRRLG